MPFYSQQAKLAYIQTEAKFENIVQTKRSGPALPLGRAGCNGTEGDSAGPFKDEIPNWTNS